ncbi:MAG: hypothetical protein ABJN26_09380 [Stappiaceae bacterium]
MTNDEASTTTEKSLIVVRNRSRRANQNWIAKKVIRASSAVSEPVWRRQKPLALKDQICP